MKELSIEQKARAYDEAIGRANDILKGYNPKEGSKATINYIFPELAESEDEKIMKEIAEFIYNSAFRPKDINKKEKWLTWFEKQGEQKSAIIIQKFRVGDEIKTNNEESLTITKIDEKGYWSDDLFICSFEDSAKWELVESEEEKIRKDIIVLVKDWWDRVNKDNISTKEQMLFWLEKQGSEPNWCHHKVDLSNCSEEYKKAYYDGWNNCNQQHSQCKSEWNDVVPAWTEEDEQYLLVCKNALAKYQTTDKWDASIISRWLETKLKSLRPQPKQEWKQENREELTEFENAMMHIGGSFFGENAGLDPNDTAAIKEQAKLLLELSPKTEWSKEDDIMVNDILRCLPAKSRPGYNQRRADWLKSLKGRVQPKQEWSEEDEDDLNNIIWLCNNCINGSEITWIPSQAIRIKSLIERIKDTIFLQSKQEWSKEDEEVRGEIIHELELTRNGLSSVSYPAYDRLILWLKSLRPQKQWKLSDEQMEALEHFIIHHNGSTNYAKDLEDLRIHLKRLKGE